MNVMVEAAYLRYDGEFGPEVMQPDGGNIHPVDSEGAARGFDDAEQCQQHGGLSSTRPAHHANLKCRAAVLQIAL